MEFSKGLLYFYVSNVRVLFIAYFNNLHNVFHAKYERNTHLPYDPGKLHSGIYPKAMKTYVHQKKPVQTKFSLVALFTISKN